MDISEKEKLRVIHDGLLNFVNSLGPNDIYKSVLLQVLLEEIYGIKEISDSVHLFGEAGQKGSEGNNDSDGGMPTFTLE